MGMNSLGDAAEIVRIRGGLLRIADNLLNDDVYQREKAAKELIETTVDLKVFEDAFFKEIKQKNHLR